MPKGFDITQKHLMAFKCPVLLAQGNSRNATIKEGDKKMTTRTETIISKAVDIIKSIPDGIRYSDLVRYLHSELPDYSVNTINGVIWNLETRIPDKIYKPLRGVYRDLIFKEKADKGNDETPPVIEKMREDDYYKPFADWLVNELEECTKAISLGGNKFKDKWGTPDVIGIREPRKSDIIRPATDIVSAEIKIDTGNLITAFGQACSYKLFSHKSYIVIPKESSEEDVTRLDALGRIFGIGLILMDVSDPKMPRFEIRVRATKHEPDMFYVNKYMKLIENELFS
jgi:hypothetical protein